MTGCVGWQEVFSLLAETKFWERDTIWSCSCWEINCVCDECDTCVRNIHIECCFTLL